MCAARHLDCIHGWICIFEAITYFAINSELYVVDWIEHLNRRLISKFRVVSDSIITFATIFVLTFIKDIHFIVRILFTGSNKKKIKLNINM